MLTCQSRVTRTQSVELGAHVAHNATAIAMENTVMEESNWVKGDADAQNSSDAL